MLPPQTIPETTVLYIPLDFPVPASLAAELEKQLFYVADEILDFTLIREGNYIHRIDVTCGSEQIAEIAAAQRQELLKRKINEVIKNIILPQRAFPSKVIWRSQMQPGGDAGTFAALLESGAAFPCGEGQVGLGEPLIWLMDYFDQRLRSIALSLSNSREFRYPTLLPTRVLERFGYFNSFPQFLLFVTRLHNDLDVYHAFVREYQENQKITANLFSHCRSHEYCLPPTMCYHTYHQFQGRRLDRDTIITSKGKSFRFESRYSRGLERLWDFTIREIVFMGSREFVLDSRRSLMERAFGLIDDCQMGGWCEVATDHFFVSPETARKLFSQRMMELKYELRMNVGADNSIAVASFNFHENFFGEAFGITRSDNQSILSGCVGFGLERLVYAFLCQHGLDASRWPTVIANALGQSHDAGIHHRAT
jgi:hypothetical protein